jgi:hypothetical protein
MSRYSHVKRGCLVTGPRNTTSPQAILLHLTDRRKWVLVCHVTSRSQGLFSDQPHSGGEETLGTTYFVIPSPRCIVDVTRASKSLK